jgi:outer membrane protein assembly factor BamB
MRTGTLWAVLVAVVAVTLSGCCTTDNKKVPTADLPAIKALPKALAPEGLILYWSGQWPLDKNEFVARINLQPGHLYAVTDRNRLMAMDSRTGQFLWDADLGSPGFDVSPVCQVGNNMAAVAVLDQLFVFDFVTGKRLLKSQLERAPSTRMVSRSDFLYFGTNDGWLEAVNVVDGSKNWSRWTQASITGAPAVDTHGVYLANTAGELTSNSLTNRFINWTYPTTGRLGSVTANLSISTGGMELILVPSRDYSLYAMNSVGGQPAWICTVGNPLSKAAHSSGDQIFFASETHVLFCTKEAGGEKPLWAANGIDDFIAASPAAVYVRSMSKAILALDPATGATKFHVPTAGLYRPVTNDLDGQLFAADADGHIICIRELKGQYDLKPAIEESPAFQPSIKKSAPKPADVSEPKK